MLPDIEFDFTSLLGVIFTVIAAAVYALLVVAEWRILEKAGEQGWKALIPFYNIFVSHHIIGMSHIWFILDILFWLGEVATEMVDNVPWLIDDSFLIAAAVFTIISEVVHVNKLCNCFRKGTAFKIGMILLPPLFTMIIAFSDAKYHPPKSLHGENEEKNVKKLRIS